MNLYEKFKKSKSKRKIQNDKHFLDVRKGLRESMINFNHTLDIVKNWDELMNIKEESSEEIKLLRQKKIRNIFILRKDYFQIPGIIFCCSQLIGVQASIIILNSLFNEIVEELQLWFNDTPRTSNFYEILESNTYRELPEIDVAMITSSVGIIFAKNYGFICSNITFQLLSSICFFLFFLLFDFHKGDQLLENYTSLEIVTLIFIYIILSFLVGCSSTIALREFWDLYSYIYKMNRDESEKAPFYFLSGLSSFLIIIINRKIFTSFKDITSKWVLRWIVIVIFISFASSMLFYGIYYIPITQKKKRLKKKDDKEKEFKDREKQKGDVNFENTCENIVIASKNEKEESESKTSELKETIIKYNYTFPLDKNKYDEIDLINLPDKEENQEKINSTKICTLYGYIYFRKETGNKKACICYYYTDKRTWFCEKLFEFDMIVCFFIELYCQVCIIGFNPILTEKLLNVYSYSKNIRFYITLFIFSVVFGVSYVSIFNDEPIKKKVLGANTCQYFDKFFVILFFLFSFTIFTFVTSICYLAEDNLTRKRWDNIFMAEFIFFKVLDLQILSFYDFLDNSDIFNTSLAITVEKFIWMIIENIIDTYVDKKKWLVLCQLIITSIPTVIIVLLLIILICS